MTIQQIIEHYNAVVRVVDNDAHSQSERAYGGFIRATKGKLQEFITEEIVRLAWAKLGGEANRLEINKHKVKLPIHITFKPLKKDAIEKAVALIASDLKLHFKK